MGKSIECEPNGYGEEWPSLDCLGPKITMENPFTWNEVEKLIAATLQQADIDDKRGLIGASHIQRIYNALKQAGYLKEGL
jgi:hypothetical protein